MRFFLATVALGAFCISSEAQEQVFLNRGLLQCISESGFVRDFNIPTCRDDTDDEGVGKASCEIVIKRPNFSQRFLAEATLTRDEAAYRIRINDPILFPFEDAVECEFLPPPGVKAIECNITSLLSAECLLLRQGSDGKPLPFRAQFRLLPLADM